MNRKSRSKGIDRLAVAAICDRLGKQRSQRLPQVREIDAILRPLWSCNTGLNICEVNVQIDGIVDLAVSRHPEHLLRPEIVLKCGALLLGPTGCAQIRDRLLIDWKK